MRRVVRVLAIVLSLQMLFAGVARAIDLHDSPGCSDAASAGSSDTGEPEAPIQNHPGNCCFGLLSIGSPSIEAAFPILQLIDAPMERGESLTVDWHSKAPERPPRS